MIRLLQYMLSGCFHKWETVEKNSFSWDTMRSKGNGTRYTLRCEKCGTIKKKDIK